MNFAFYKTHLERVSRSFSLCIQELSDKLLPPIAINYLLCRVLDTYEDCQENLEYKIKQIEIFLQSLEPGATEKHLDQLDIPQGIPTSEVSLLEEFPILLSEYRKLDIESQKVLYSEISKMAHGMKEFLVLCEKMGSELSLSSVSELNRYCYFVAGVVGEGLTELVQNYLRKLNVPISEDLNFSNSIAFGLFLQKINILKDRKDDLDRGFSYYQNEADVYLSLLPDIRSSVSYLKSIPDELSDYRIFCGFSFFLGLGFLLTRLNPQFYSRPSRNETLALMESLKETPISDTFKLMDMQVNNITALIKKKFKPNR